MIMTYVLNTLSSYPVEYTFMRLIFKHDFLKTSQPQTWVHSETILIAIGEFFSPPDSVLNFVSMVYEKAILMPLINILVTGWMGLNSLHLNLICLIGLVLFPVSWAGVGWCRVKSWLTSTASLVRLVSANAFRVIASETVAAISFLSCNFFNSIFIFSSLLLKVIHALVASALAWVVVVAAITKDALLEDQG